MNDDERMRKLREQHEAFMRQMQEQLTARQQDTEKIRALVAIAERRLKHQPGQE